MEANMEVKAYAKSVRMSPQKVRLVADQIKKMGPIDAVKILDYIPKRSALPLKKVVASAIANAKNNFGLSEDTLVFKTIEVNKGMVFKRFRPVSRGRAHAILRRTSNIRIVITGEKTPSELKKVLKIKGPKEDKKEENGTKS